MIYPPIEELTKHGAFNRYTLVIATAKCARIVTDEYVQQRETAEKMLANKETDKSLASMIKREFRDEKAVKSAIKRLHLGEFIVLEPGKEPDITHDTIIDADSVTVPEPEPETTDDFNAE